MFAITVYLLCAIASSTCAFLLYRSYHANRNQMAFWTAVAFSFFALNNFFVVIDFVIAPGLDFSLFRTIPLAIGSGVLIFGLVWESV